MLRPALAILLGLLVVASAMSETAQQRPGDETSRSAQQGPSDSAAGTEQERSGDAASEPEPQRPGVGEWQVYRSDRYGYEIRYPSSHEVWPTGPAGERDGRSIRIARTEHAAPAPILDLYVLREPSDAEKLAWGEVADLSVTAEDMEVGGVRARVVRYRWKSNGELLFVEMYLRNVFIRFHAGAGLREARETVWWRIMTSLRFLGD